MKQHIFVKNKGSAKRLTKCRLTAQSIIKYKKISSLAYSEAEIWNLSRLLKNNFLQHRKNTFFLYS